MNKFQINPLAEYGFDKKGWASLFNWLSLMRNTLAAGLFKDVTQTTGVASGVATTVYSIPSLSTTATWLISCTLGNKNDTSNFSAFAIVLSDGSACRFALQNNGVQQSLSLSGLNVQCTQSSGASQSVITSVTRIA